MTRLVFVLLAACGSAAELGAPNPPPEWPMGTDLHSPPPAPVAPTEAPADPGAVTAGPEGSAAPPTEVTEPPAPTPEVGPDGAEPPVAPEPTEEQ